MERRQAEAFAAIAVVVEPAAGAGRPAKRRDAARDAMLLGDVRRQTSRACQAEKNIFTKSEKARKAQKAPSFVERAEPAFPFRRRAFLLVFARASPPRGARTERATQYRPEPCPRLVKHVSIALRVRTPACSRATASTRERRVGFPMLLGFRCLLRASGSRSRNSLTSSREPHKQHDVAFVQNGRFIPDKSNICASATGTTTESGAINEGAA